MKVQAVSFGNEQTNNNKGAKIGGAAVGGAALAGLGYLGGKGLTKLNEDTFVKMAIEDQATSSQKAMGEARTAIRAEGITKDVKVLETYEKELKELTDATKTRRPLTVAEGQLANLYEKDPVTKKPTTTLKAGKTTADVTAAEAKVKEAAEAYQKATEGKVDVAKMRSDFKAKYANKTPDAKVIADNEATLVKQRALNAEVQAYRAETDVAKQAESTIVKNFKETFKPAEGAKRSEEGQKLFDKLTKEAKGKKGKTFALIGAGIGVIGIIAAALSGSKKTAA